MNILQVLSHRVPSGDGIFTHVIGLAERLRTRNHRVTLMTRGQLCSSKEYEYQGFRIINVPFYPIYPCHVHLHGYFIRKAIESLLPKPDLIHLHSPLVPPVLKKWPIVTTFHTPMLVDSMYIESVGVKTFLTRLMSKTTSFHIEKRLLKISDAIITVSQSVADELRMHYRYSGGNLYPILNVVDTEFYSPSLVFPSRKNLLYIGRLGYRKGLFEIIESAKEVIQKQPDVKYILVGSGPLESNLRKMVRRLNLCKNFEFCGEVRDNRKILKFYHESRVVLIPSYYEGFPMVLAEAMACGKAIITTTAGFAKGILRNGFNALLINPKSSEKLVNATLRLLSSRQLCEELGRAARKTALEKMRPEINTDKVEEVYRCAIKKWAPATRQIR